MNILHLMKDYKPTIGGSVVRNSKILENYKNEFMDDNIYLLNMEGNKFDDYSEIEGIRIYRAKSLQKLISLAIHIIKNENIDIIHAHNFRFLFAAYSAKLLVRKRVKLVFEIHAMYHMSILKEWLSYKLLKKADKIIVLADCARNYLMNNCNISSEKISVIRNGIEHQVTEQKSENFELLDKITKKAGDKIVVGYIGSFFEWQGVNFLADNINTIMNSSSEMILLLVGNGPDYDYVKGKCTKTSFSKRIILCPGIEKKQMGLLMKYIDIMLIPRLKNLSTDTAVPLKVIEAMEYGKCILAANDNGLLEVLDNSNAAIFESGNIEDFRRKLHQLISDKGLRKKLSTKAFRDAKKLFVTWEESSIKLHQLYKEL